MRIALAVKVAGNLARSILSYALLAGDPGHSTLDHFLLTALPSGSRLLSLDDFRLTAEGFLLRSPTSMRNGILKVKTIKRISLKGAMAQRMFDTSASEQ
jgi:hypothetical protein